MYVNSHFAITTLALAWIYLRRNERFYFVRNMFMVAMGIALIGYVALPTAPPRMMPEWGFTDSVQAFTGVDHDAGSTGVLFNPFAAIPSMHVAFSLMLGVTMARMTRRRWAQMLWYAYCPVVTFVVSPRRTTGGSTDSSARWSRWCPRSPLTSCSRVPARRSGRGTRGSLRHCCPSLSER